MNSFFDVDYTLITWDYRLRPNVRGVFERLRAGGHTIYWWSGMGRRWEVVQRFDLTWLIADCFDKLCLRYTTPAEFGEMTIERVRQPKGRREPAYGELAATG